MVTEARGAHRSVRPRLASGSLAGAPGREGRAGGPSPAWVGGRGMRSDVSRRSAAMRDGWRPQDRTRGLTRMIHVKPWRCSTMGPQVRTPGPAGCAGCFTWNQQAMLGSLPPRVETSVLTRMGRLRPSLRPTPAGVGHANRPGRPGAAAAFRCSANRLRMHGCFTWNRRQRPGGRRPSEPDAGPGCLMREPVRCPTALVLGDSDGPQATKIHLELRRCSPVGARLGRRTGWMFHVEPGGVFGRTTPPDSDARTG